MNPEYPQFKKLNISDKCLFKKYMHNYPRGLCELNFATQIIWKDFDNPQYTFINGNLCILISPKNEKPFFLEPIGRKKVISTLKTCLEHSGRISRASAQYSHILPQTCYNAEPVTNHFDYIYLTRTLSELKGRKFDGKRNHIKRFQKTYPNYQYLPITTKHRTKAIELFNKWFTNKKLHLKSSESTSDLAYEAELSALKSTFKEFEALDLCGGGIFVDGSLKGFCVWSEQNKKMASAHFMYGDPDIKNIYQILTWETCHRLSPRYTYINLEQDLGIPGIRKSKLSYYPVKIEEKFEIKLNA